MVAAVVGTQEYQLADDLLAVAGQVAHHQRPHPSAQLQESCSRVEELARRVAGQTDGRLGQGRAGRPSEGGGRPAHQTLQSTPSGQVHIIDVE